MYQHLNYLDRNESSGTSFETQLEGLMQRAESPHPQRILNCPPAFVFSWTASTRDLTVRVLEVMATPASITGYALAQKII